MAAEQLQWWKIAVVLLRTTVVDVVSQFVVCLQSCVVVADLVANVVVRLWLHLLPLLIVAVDRLLSLIAAVMLLQVAVAVADKESKECLSELLVRCRAIAVADQLVKNLHQ